MEQIWALFTVGGLITTALAQSMFGKFIGMFLCLVGLILVILKR